MNFKLHHMFVVYVLGTLFLGDRGYAGDDPKAQHQKNQRQDELAPQVPVVPPPVSQDQVQNQQELENIQHLLEDIEHQKQILKAAHQAALEKFDSTMKTYEDSRKDVEIQLKRVQSPQEIVKTEAQNLYQEWYETQERLEKIQSNIKNFKIFNSFAPKNPQGLERLCNAEKKAQTQVNKLEAGIQQIQTIQNDQKEQEEGLKDNLNQTNLQIKNAQQRREELKSEFDQQMKELENKEQNLHISSSQVQNSQHIQDPIQPLNKHNLDQQD